MSSIRKFGAELEYAHCVSRTRLESFVRNAVIEHSDHPIRFEGESRDWWNAKDEHCGSELTTPCLSFTKANLDMVCKVIEELNVEIKKNILTQKPIADNCGLHLHIDTVIKSEDKNAWVRFFKIWQCMESPIFSVLPAHRRNNGNIGLLQYAYSCNNSFRKGEDYPASKSMTAHYVRGSHIEIRHAPSTLSGEYFFQWCALVRSIVEIAEGFALKCKYPEDNIFADMPQDYRGRLEAKVLIEFITANEKFIETQWIKHNMVKMIRWICAQHKEIYGRTVEIAA